MEGFNPCRGVVSTSENKDEARILSALKIRAEAHRSPDVEKFPCQHSALYTMSDRSGDGTGLKDRSAKASEAVR